MSEDEFFDLLEAQGVSARTDYDRFIVQGELPVPDENLFGPHFRREIGTVETRDGQTAYAVHFVPR